MHFKDILILSILILGSFGLKSFAQRNYISGTVIHQNGDTLHGWIDYQNWERNPRVIRFKSNEEGEIQKFSPLQIHSFKLDKEYYVSAIIDIEISMDRTNSLSDQSELLLEKDTVFLQNLYTGSKSLYYNKDQSGRDHFYIGVDQEYMLLIYKKYIAYDRHDSHFTGENKKFIGQLTYYLDECKGISNLIQQSEYNKNSLVNVFHKYYQCLNEEAVFKKQKDHISVDFGVLAGLTMTNLELSQNFPSIIVHADYQTSYSFSAGLFLDLFFVRNISHWSFNSELFYSTYDINGSARKNYGENYWDINEIQFAYSYLKLNNMIRYKHSFKDVSVFANLGVSNGFVISETNKRVIESHVHAVYSTDEVPAILETRGWEIGWLAGFGLGYKAFALEFRYEKANGMSDYERLKSTVARNHFLLSYRF